MAKKKMDYATLRALLEELKAILGENDEEEAEVAEEEAPAKKSKKNDGKKSAKKPDPEPEEDDEDDDSDDSDEEEGMSVQEQVEAATEDMSDKEIADFCADNGLSPKGKRAALIKRIVEAVESGDIELDGDDDDDEEEEEEKPSKKSDKAQKSSKKSKKDEDEDEDDDDDGDDDEEAEPTKERLAALKKFDKDTRASFKKGELERDDLVDFLCTFYNKKAKDYKKASDKEILDLYIEASSNLISDEGEVVEEGAYTVNGVPFCCGRALDYDEDNEQYVCSVCGGEYSADDDE